MGRAASKHIDSDELHALVPSPSETYVVVRPLSSAERSELRLHVSSCSDCRDKLQLYRRLVNTDPDLPSASAPSGTVCPTSNDVNWPEVAAGLWPELKAQQLILHAAMCEYCGPQLRAAVRQRHLREKEDSKNTIINSHVLPTPAYSWSSWSPSKWFPVVVALILVVVWWSAKPFLPSGTLSGARFAKLAVLTHKEHAQGRFPLDFRTDSRQTLNEWLHSNAGLVLPSPNSMPLSGEAGAYRLEGARVLPFGSQTAAYISYAAAAANATPATVSLMVTPGSVVAAEGGFEVDFPKVSFHYSTLDGYKVVTWSVHGMTYALVAGEDFQTQQSCLVCHASSSDPALHRTPTFSGTRRTIVPLWQ